MKQHKNNQKDTNLFGLSSLNEICKGNKDSLVDLILTFKEIISEDIHNMNVAFNDRNFDTLAFIVHKMKASIKLLEVTSIESDLLLLEKHCIEKLDEEKLHIYYDKTIKILTLVLKQLNELNINEIHLNIYN